MTRVDFYILPDSDDEARLRFASRLTDKALRLGNRVFLACRDQAHAQALSDVLWSLRPESFIGHNVLNQPVAATLPAAVEIGWESACGDHHDLLINLSDEIPAYFSRFQRVAEIICQQPQLLEAKRQHFGFYRERGYPIQSNDMRPRA